MLWVLLAEFPVSRDFLQHSVVVEVFISPRFPFVFISNFKWYSRTLFASFRDGLLSVSSFILTNIISSIFSDFIHLNDVQRFSSPQDFVSYNSPTPKYVFSCVLSRRVLEGEARNDGDFCTKKFCLPCYSKIRFLCLRWTMQFSQLLHVQKSDRTSFLLAFLWYSLGEHSSIRRATL